MPTFDKASCCTLSSRLYRPATAHSISTEACSNGWLHTILCDSMLVAGFIGKLSMFIANAAEQMTVADRHKDSGSG